MPGARRTARTHSTHTLHRVLNLFPRTRHAKRGLQTSKNRKNGKKQLSQWKNKQTARNITLQKLETVHTGLRSMLNPTKPLSTHYMSPGKHLFPYKASQTKSVNMQNLDKHSFPLRFAAMSLWTPFSRLGPREITIQNPKKILPHTSPVCSLVFENRAKAFISMNQSKTMEIFRFEIFPWLWGFYGIYYGADQKSNHRQAISKTTRQW